MAMMAMTTSNSINVNPFRAAGREGVFFMAVFQVSGLVSVWTPFAVVLLPGKNAGRADLWTGALFISVCFHNSTTINVGSLRSGRNCAFCCTGLGIPRAMTSRPAFLPAERLAQWKLSSYSVVWLSLYEIALKTDPPQLDKRIRGKVRGHGGISVKTGQFCVIRRNIAVGSKNPKKLLVKYFTMGHFHTRSGQKSVKQLRDCCPFRTEFLRECNDFEPFCLV
jgi:hypothetical protein